ncbi:hypothetical protein [Flectobacillus major]|uniref:hypothetical protein n=1 Tax=Flectobacillus major TaxID=103 RepID=UPI0003FAC888|nr:hypothetical protein [Flectobacillus major]
MENIKHIGTLNGRIFLVSGVKAFKQWRGIRENENSETNYDLLDDFISYEEGDLTLFKKSLTEVFSVFFSMSSKIEIFKKDNRLIIFDGLYFNESWDDYIIKNQIEVIGEISFEINFNDEVIVIFDATLDGNKVFSTNKEGVWSSFDEPFNSYATVTLPQESYKAKRIKTIIYHNKQEVIIYGIEFLPN